MRKEARKGAKTQRCFVSPAPWKRVAAWAAWLLLEPLTWLIPTRWLRAKGRVKGLAIWVYGNSYWLCERYMGRV